MDGKRVLIVEDDHDIAHLVELHLRDAGCEVAVAADGAAGMRRVEGARWDLVILDLMLPGVEGLEICRRIRAAGDYTPVLMLTAKSAEVDRVVGLEVGADDYLTKPFGIRELLARVKAIFRRVDALAGSGGEAEGPIEIGPLRIEPRERRVVVEGREVRLTAKEFDLLEHFARHPGRVFTRSQLLDQVWGYAHQGYEHTVNSHINRLRGKLEEDPSHPRWIETVWGVGYRLAEPAPAGAAVGED